MSLIKTGGGVSAISGKTAGTVYARNKAGAYTRNWAKPINPGSSRQTDVRSSFAAGSAHFGMLSLDQVNAWIAYASGLTRLNRLGDPYTPTGRQIFIEIYNNLIAAGLTFLSVPSPYTNVPAINALGAFVLESDGGEIGTMTLAATTVVVPSTAAGVLLVEATPPHKASKVNTNTQFRQIFSGVPSGAHNLAAGYINVFGNSLEVGQVVDFRVRVIDNDSGLGSTRMLASIQAAAA